MTPREERGLVIAATCRLNRMSDGTWLVPSQPKSGTVAAYSVNLEAKTCTCLDHKEGGFTCKHYYAASITHKRDVLPDGTVIDTKTITLTEKKVYKQDWRAYNLAQSVEAHRFQELLFDFGGIGGWELALRLAGWEWPCWTGSCPCQPYSAAGKGKGDKDTRNLWPQMYRLIRECHPITVFGEQVASAIGHGWLDGVSADLEREGYAVGSVVLGAHSVGAPHIRQRLYWVGLLPDAARDGGRRNVEKRQTDRRTTDRRDCPWIDFAAIPCHDGKSRRISVEPGDVPLAYGIPRDMGSTFPELAGMGSIARSNRVGRLRGYGNAIVPTLAAEFIKAVMDTDPRF